MMLSRWSFLAVVLVCSCEGSDGSTGGAGAAGGTGGAGGGAGQMGCPPPVPNGWPFGVCDVPSSLVCVSGMLDCCIPVTHSIDAESQCIDNVWQITNLDQCDCDPGAGGAGGEAGSPSAGGEGGVSGHAGEGGAAGER